MKRHALITRVWHWLTAISLIVLFMSGLNISNAHPRLYWGHAGFASEEAWLHLIRYPGWMTIPGHYSLAQARSWHLFFAWPLALGLTIFMIASLANGHFRRDLVTRWREWRWSAVKADIAKHFSLDFSTGASKYNFLQKASYGLIIFVFLPVMIFSGIAMSPAMDANWPWVVDMFGGRQSARSIHFLCAWALMGFLLLHVIMVLLSGPLRQLGGMITGGRRSEEEA